MADSTESRSVTQTNNEIDEKAPGDGKKGPNVFRRVKDEVHAMVKIVNPKKESKKKEGEEKKSKEAKASPQHPHTKETHGKNDDIDETTSVDGVKGPNVFSRMKEEVEAIVEAIHPKKDKDDHK